MHTLHKSKDVKPFSFFQQKKSRLRLERIIDNLLLGFAIAGFIAVFLDIAELKSNDFWLFNDFYNFCLVVFLLLFGLRAYLNRFVFRRQRERWLVWTELVSLAVLLLAQMKLGFFEVFATHGYIQFAIFFIFMAEISKHSLRLEKLRVNPPLLFVFSFIVLILLGTFGLMLPDATVNGMGFIDALFTSTSAVCVTGLSVEDTGTFFTRFGQNVLLVLISLGGLGVMTFTSFFGLFFKGETSFQNQKIYMDFTGESNITGVFSTIVKIVVFTIAVELVGTMALFFSLNPADFGGDYAEQFYFSFFHSISAFNNAGFQLKAAGLYDGILRYNYSFQSIIAVLIIMGGLGFAISFNIVRYLRERLEARGRHLLLGEPLRHVPWIINLNTRIVLRTTIILLVIGTVVFFFTEYNSSLKEHDTFGKWVISFFCSVTPRTAGFNNIDMATLTREGILITMLLMWIGASPGSTGGGIKTTTFAVATLGIFSIARGRTHIEFGRREIAKESLMRSFIIICLSLIVLGFSILGVGFFDPDLDLVKIAFECFSAYSTVGLSLGITASLSDMGKIIIVLTMFVGRVGAYTLLLGMLKKAMDSKLYRYPVEHVTIT